MKSITVIATMLFLTFCACSRSEQKNENVQNQESKKDEDVKHKFPFDIMTIDGEISIAAYLESEELYNQFNPVFQKYNFEGSGYTWEGVIIQIIEQRDKELLNHLEFDSEAGAFFVYPDNEETANKFLDLICPFFSDSKTLDETLKNIDPKKIDD